MSDRDLLVGHYLSAAVDDLDIEVEPRFTGGRPMPQRPRGWRRAGTVAFALALSIVTLVVVARSFLGDPSTPGAGRAGAILFERWELTPEKEGFPNPEIWSMDENGASAAPLPQPLGRNTAAVWSPDRRTIAFVGQGDLEEPSSTLWLMDADGGNLRSIADGFDVDDPTWSPDGAEIAFIGSRRSEGASAAPPIWIAPADGGEPRLLIDKVASQLSWSPDGTRIAFIASDATGETSDLFVVGTDGSGLTRLTNDGAEYANPAWSPDGSRLAFARAEPPDLWNWDVYTMRVDGSDLQQLTTWRGWDSRPVWSPDGTRILFTSDREATPAEAEVNRYVSAGERGLAIFVMDRDGQHERLLFDDGAMQDVPTSWG